MRLLCIEKCETRQMAAADLALSLQPDVLPLESFQVGQFCTAMPFTAPPVYEIAERESVILDVDRDGYVTPNDMALIVRQLSGSNEMGPILPEGEQAVDYQFDVNQDGVISPADALTVLSRLDFYNPLVPCNCANCLANAVVDGV
ncbi:MAG: dockerin type I domain-containing protein [Pirellulaceae bacterium]|nr:hypothetical protein [Planctomycetales bacterium]